MQDRKKKKAYDSWNSRLKSSTGEGQQMGATMCKEGEAARKWRIIDVTRIRDTKNTPSYRLKRAGSFWSYIHSWKTRGNQLRAKGKSDGQKNVVSGARKAFFGGGGLIFKGNARSQVLAAGKTDEKRVLENRQGGQELLKRANKKT